MATHLFKLFHGEHLLGELQYQIVPHCASKHLVEKAESQREHGQSHKQISLQTSRWDLIIFFPRLNTNAQTFWTVSWMSALGRVMFSPRSREEVIWRSSREQDGDRDEL